MRKHDYDFHQRFDGSSTALQVLHGRDLTGQVALITGANVGIGYETARALAKHGCSVIFACRNLKSARTSIDKIKEEKKSAGDTCKAIHLNLSSLQSVAQFCDNVKSKYKKLDIIILNAGVFGLPYSKTVDNIETTFQVNHLSHLYMLLLLEQLLVSGSRVVVVASECHRYSSLTVDTVSPSVLAPESSDKYWDVTAYNDSKLCNVLMARQLAKSWQTKGILVLSAHPGNFVSSNLSLNWWPYRIFFAIVRPFTKSLQQAAGTSVFCATAPELTGVTGVYFNNCYRCEESKSAQNDKLAQAVWDISVQMIHDVLNSDTK